MITRCPKRILSAISAIILFLSQFGRKNIIPIEYIFYLPTIIIKTFSMGESQRVILMGIESFTKEDREKKERRVERKLLSAFPRLKEDLESHADELILIYRVIASYVPVGSDNPDLRISRDPPMEPRGHLKIHNDPPFRTKREPPTMQIGIIARPYFKFDKDSIYEPKENYRGQIVVRNKLVFSQKDILREMHRGVGVSGENMYLYLRDTTRQLFYKKGRDDTKQKFHVSRFDLVIGNVAVEKYFIERYDGKGNIIYDRVKKMTDIMLKLK